jgi:uncharacterized membrane protein YbhN (UPF0104 family)
MSVSAANETARSRGAEKLAIVAGKLLVTAVCFWYLAHEIDFGQLYAALLKLELPWMVAAVALVMIEIPLVGLRWQEILRAMAVADRRITSAAIIAITAIGVFFSQVLPSVAGEGIRAWLLVRLGCDWRNSVASIILDRGVGVAVLVALGFAVLLLPSGLTALGQYRDLVLIIYGALLVATGIGFLLLPFLNVLLRKSRYLRWIADLGELALRVSLSRRIVTILALACLIHTLSLVVVWLVGRSQGLVLPVADAAVLLVVAIGVNVVPISINGWGLREIAVVALLGQYGISPEQALLFSVCFGLLLAIGSLPGALVWILYSITPLRRSVAYRQ